MGWRILAIVIAVSALALAFFHTHSLSASTTPLADLANSLQPGTWAELATNNIAPTLAFTGGASGNTFGFTENGVWDPLSRQFLYIGGDHAPTMPDTCPRFVSYHESTNTWQMLPEPAWFPCTPGTAMHGYDHTAIDPIHRNLYHRPYNDMVVRKLDMSTNTWTNLPSIPTTVMANRNCCVGVAWFPERNSLIYASVETSSNGSVIEYQESTGQWQRLGSSVPNLPMGTHQQFAEYNPVNKVVVFGGGAGSHDIYKVDSLSQVTALQPAPISLGVEESIFTVDPVSGKYLVFNNLKQFWVYDVNQDTWDLQSGTPPIFNTPVYDPPVHGIVATPVDSYGVTMFVKCVSSDCHVYLYKHYPDNVPPTVSITSPGSGSTISGTVTVAANAADNVGVAGVQFKLDGKNLGVEVKTAPYSVSLDTTTLLNGAHTLSAVARDAAGNRTTSAATPVTVSNAIPFSFSLSVSGVEILTQGQTTSLTIAATGLAGPSQPVSFSASGLPADAAYSFPVASSCTPNPGCTVTVNFSTLTSTPAGQYPITLTGTAGSVTQTASFTLTVSPVNPSFTEKCGQPGNLSCFSFDDSSKIFYTWPTGTVCDAAFAGKTNYPFGNNRSGPGNAAAVVQNGQCMFPQVDTASSHSGAGSLKFTIGSNSSANSSGFFTELFKRNADGTFPYIAPGSPSGNVLYFQFYQKFDSTFLSTDFQCIGGTCGGWKQAILYGNPPNGASASSVEVTMNDGYQRGVPQMYGQQGLDDYGVQNIIGCTFAKATSLGGSGSGFNSQPNYSAPLNPTCVHYAAGQWMEFTVRVEVRGNPNDAASRVQLWVNGQLVIDNGLAKINWGSTDGDGLGQFQLTPYHTNKDPNQVHSTGTTWFDDVIVSTQPIPMVNGGIPTPDTTPPAISNIVVSGITSSAATIVWTTNKAADTQVYYGPTSSYGFATPLDTSLVTTHSASLSALSASTTYHFSLKSKDVTGNLGTSPDITFTTLPPADTTPPVISAVTATNISEIGATISWTTDEPADSQVEYGISTSYGGQTTRDTSLVTSHSQTFAGLTAGTTYNYRIKSRDASGNLATSGNFTFTTAPPGPPSTSGLIGYWGFNDGSGTVAADSSGNNNHAALWPNISPVWISGKVGTALQFNATDGDNNDNDDPRVTIGRNFDISGVPFTLSAWVNPANFADWRAIFSKRDSFQSAAQWRFDWGLHKDSGAVYLKAYNSSVDFTYAPPVNTWTHLTVVASTTDTKLYVNGILTQQAIGGFSFGTGATANAVIGGTGDQGALADDDPFSGSIDEVRIYNRAVTASEIQDIYFFNPSDVIPPAVSNIVASQVTNKSATITWTTNEPADTQVDYGTTPSYGQSTALNTSLVGAHSINLSGLASSTTYHFRSKSKDAAGNLSVSQDYTFTTGSTPSISLSPATLQNPLIGVVYNQIVAASGGFPPYIYSVATGTLANGLTLNSATGAITGTPITSGIANFTIQAIDSAGNVGARQYSVNTSNLISDNVFLAFNNRTYDSAPSPGFVGRLTLNFTLTNIGPPITSPMFVQIVEIQKLGNLDPGQPDYLGSADNGLGTVGDKQTLPVTSLATGESTPLSFVVLIGTRQTFVLSVDLRTQAPAIMSPLVALSSSAKEAPDTSTTTTTFVGRFRFEVSEASLASSTFAAGPPVRTAVPGSSGSAISNIALISGPGPQSRPTVAVDPVIPTQIAVASNDYAAGTVRVMTTQDGGTTWQSSVMSRTVMNQTFFTAQDPSVAFDSRGHLSVVYSLSNLNDSANAIAISESSDGISFNPPDAITFHLASDRVIDSRPVVAIRAGTGRYVAWDSLSTATFRSSINVARSEEGGLFGTATTVISNGRFSAPTLALGTSTVYVGWNDWGFNAVSPFTAGGRLMIASSPSGPQLNFGTPQEIAKTSIGFGQRIPAMPDLGVGPKPNLAVDPTTDNLVYGVFTDRGNGMDIRLARSSDSGATWQVSTVNNDGTMADQFSPAIVIDSAGNPNIIFEDTRLSGTFESVDVFLATRSAANSFDNQRITTASSNDSRRNLRRDFTANLGDRTAIALTGNDLVLAWTDTRLASEDIFLSIVKGAEPAKPAIVWNNPASITYGTPLATAQLNAATSTPGTFAYNPPSGTVLDAGLQTLSVTFTPSDTAHFTSAIASVQVNVIPAPLTVKADSKSRFYSSPNPLLTGSIGGVVNYDNITVGYTTAATVTSMPGNYAIKPVIADPNHRISNYSVSSTDGVLTVIPAPIMTLSIAGDSGGSRLSSDSPAIQSAVSSVSLAFGNRNLLSKNTLSLVVGNIGTASLVFDNVALDGPNAGDFEKGGTCGTTVDVAKTCTIDITFTPSALHNRSGTITLTDNDGGYKGSQQTVNLSGNSILRYAVYALDTNCEAIVLSGKSAIDGFDSTGPTNNAGGADVGVNGNITLNGNASVNGTIYAPNTNVGVCKNKGPIPGITVSGTGKTSKTDGSSILPPIPFTTSLAVTAGTSDVKVKRDSDGRPLSPGAYRDITVEGGATLALVPGGTYNIRSLKLSNSAKVAIGPPTSTSSGPVIINVAGTNDGKALDFSGGSVTNPGGKPENLFFFYGGSGEIELTGDADSYGIIYAPNADAKLSGNGDWYGAMVVKTLKDEGNSALHYDRNLGR